MPKSYPRQRTFPIRFSFSLVFVLALFSASFRFETLHLQTFSALNLPVNTPLSALAPFYHGVASGDPLPDRVILWTRVTPHNATDLTVSVRWEMATDAEMKNVVQSGSTTTDASADYTVKIDATGLLPSQTYFYQFESLGKKSIIGRTRTAPKGNSSDHLRFAVVSCNNFPDGYFNAYARLAERPDLDGVIHLGDYIYEYGEGKYNLNGLGRLISPTTEIVDLADYRMRYSQYRMDADFIRVHQQHPFICVWDDHESANDSHKTGAQNHQNSYEGSWDTRKAAAKQAYFEWLPIRNHPERKIIRRLSFGDLADLVLLDTRLEGRDEQLETKRTAEYADTNRTILGKEQREWLFETLQNSTAKWKIIGQQVVFSELNTQFMNPLNRKKAEDMFLDIWNGYPADRARVMRFIEEKNIDNIVFLTGDFHTSYAFDVAKNPTNPQSYDPSTGKGSVAVEFVTPSITSSNVDEYLSQYQTRKVEKCINHPCGGFPFFNKNNPNPHIKYVDLDRHGYFILDLTPERAQADFYYVETILTPNPNEYFESGWKTEINTNYLQPAAAVPTTSTPTLAPAFKTQLEEGAVCLTGVHLKGKEVYLQVFAGGIATSVCLELKDEAGKLLRKIVCPMAGKTLYTLHFNASNLEAGKYQITENGKNPFWFAVE